MPASIKRQISSEVYHSDQSGNWKSVLNWNHFLIPIHNQKLYVNDADWPAVCVQCVQCLCLIYVAAEAFTDLKD